jgi:transcriptional regulator with XRE-family HTH domain
MGTPSRGAPRTKVERSAARQAREIAVRIGTELRIAREDAGLSLARVALASGLSKSRLHDIEAGTCQPRWETVIRIGTVLGMSLGVRLFAGTGPLIRDHFQTAMIGALLSIRHKRWRPRPEVAVYRPVRGVIDLALDASDEPVIVACESHSDLRRIEQQVRWAQAKADALLEASVPKRPVSRLLLLRSTQRTRALAAQYADLLAAAYPAPASDAYAALTGEAPWPGHAILWTRVDGDTAVVMPRPPRGVRVGR